MNVKPALLGQWDVYKSGNKQPTLRLMIDGGGWKAYRIRRAGLPLPEGLGAFFAGRWEVIDNALLQMQLTRVSRSDLAKITSLGVVFLPTQAIADALRISARTAKKIKGVAVLAGAMSKLMNMLKLKKLHEEDVFWKFALVKIEESEIIVIDSGDPRSSHEVWRRVQ